MNAERWARVKEVFSGALEADSGERPAYLDRYCAGDADLRREVESLLAASRGGDDSLPGQTTLSLRAAEQAVLERALGRQYEILRLLGQGGMGAVYLARDRMLDRFVAIKVLRPELADTPEIRERFRREAKVAAKLSHPGILPLHAFGEVGGLWYFVMGYVRGTTLAERLRLEGQIRPAEAHRILLQLADALDCAHRRGIIHRDIKPANVLLDADTGAAILADFGISKLRDAGDSLTKSGMVVGTPHFMSPEQSLGSAQVDETSDIYSLGAVGYAMLVGREPFADTPREELAYLRATQDPPPLRTAAPNVPEELADAVMQCLHRSRAARFQTARALRDALASAAGDVKAALPEELRDVPTFGPYALGWIIAWTWIGLAGDRSPGERVLLLLIATLIPTGLVLHIWNVGRHGLTFGQVARAAFWPPEWWGMWWPRMLRRPNDLWPSLPRVARVVRVTASASLVLVPILILGRNGIAALLGSRDMTWFFAAEGALAAIGIGAVLGGLLWSRARGLEPGESFRLLFGATVASAAWRSSGLARLLDATTAGVRAPDRDSPSDHRRAIAEVVERLPHEVEVTGAQALAAADRLVGAIDRCDAESAALGNVAGIGEVDRLQAQLGSLDRGHGIAVQEQGEMRDLLARQLDVARRAHARGETIARRRARLCDLLRALWTHTSRLGATRSADGWDGTIERLAALQATIADEMS